MSKVIDIINNSFENKPLAVMENVSGVLRAKVAEILQRERPAIMKSAFEEVSE
jgi:hypothetical protein